MPGRLTRGAACRHTPLTPFIYAAGSCWMSQRTVSSISRRVRHAIRSFAQTTSPMKEDQRARDFPAVPGRDLRRAGSCSFTCRSRSNRSFRARYGGTRRPPDRPTWAVRHRSSAWPRVFPSRLSPSIPAGESRPPFQRDRRTIGWERNENMRFVPTPRLPRRRWPVFRSRDGRGSGGGDDFAGFAIGGSGGINAV
jgi:hypothetical protein